MACKIIVIPFNAEREEFEEKKLEKFLEKADVRSMERSFFKVKDKPYWSVFIEYSPRTDGDPRHNMTDAQRQRYEKLREWRNARAEREGIPPYVIASNRQLGKMAAMEKVSKSGLADIKGWGQSKAEKFANDIIHLLMQQEEVIQKSKD